MIDDKGVAAFILALLVTLALDILKPRFFTEMGPKKFVASALLAGVAIYALVEIAFWAIQHVRIAIV